MKIIAPCIELLCSSKSLRVLAALAIVATSPTSSSQALERFTRPLWETVEEIGAAMSSQGFDNDTTQGKYEGSQFPVTFTPGTFWKAAQEFMEALSGHPLNSVHQWTVETTNDIEFRKAQISIAQELIIKAINNSKQAGPITWYAKKTDLPLLYSIAKKVHTTKPFKHEYSNKQSSADLCTVLFPDTNTLETTQRFIQEAAHKLRKHGRLLMLIKIPVVPSSHDGTMIISLAKNLLEKNEDVSKKVKSKINHILNYYDKVIEASQYTCEQEGITVTFETGKIRGLFTPEQLEALLQESVKEIISPESITDLTDPLIRKYISQKKLQYPRSDIPFDSHFLIVKGIKD